MSGVSPTVRRRQLATELRGIRDTSGLMLEELAKPLGWNASKLSRILTAQSGIRLADLRKLLDALEVSDQALREHLTELARQASQKGWWHQYSDLLSTPYSVYIGLETDAASIRTFEAQLLPGLVQTEAYARETLRATGIQYRPSEIARIVAVRTERQALLTKDDPLKLWAVLDEAVLRRAVGGPEVMREQLHHLAELTELPNVTLQIIPFDAGAHASMEGTFVIMGFPAPAHPDVVYLEDRTGALYLEKQSEVEDYSFAFDHLRAIALGPDDSVSMIRAVADGFGGP